MLVDQRGRAREDAARGGEVDGVVGHLHARPGVAVDPTGEAPAGDCVGRLGDAERGRGVKQPGHEVALHVGCESPARKPPRTADSGSSTPSSETELLARGAHPERVPVVVNDDAGRVGGDHCVGVALDPITVGVRTAT